MISKQDKLWKVNCNYCGKPLIVNGALIFSDLLEKLRLNNWQRVKIDVEKSYPVYEDICSECSK